MLEVAKIRKDFPMLNGTKMHDQPLIYFDNGATTLKPQCVIDAVCNYLTNYSGNAHRGDYDLSHDVDVQFERTRELVSKFINCDSKEVVYTYGSTDGLNLVAFGYGLTHLNEGDEVLITLAEHASNTLPWFEVSKQTGSVVKYIDLDEDGTFNEEEINKITTIDLSGRTEIQSLNGINTLTNLQELNCSDMYLTTLDVSALSKLQTMLASDNQFSQIDLTNNVSLEVLNISSNPLTSIDLTHLTNLSYLNCDQTLLSALDVSNNVNLYFLSLDSTNVQYLDLSKNTKLSDFSGDKVNLGYLHLPSNGNLKQIYLNKTQTVPITVDKTSFDLSSLFPGIEASQISNVQQAEITGTTISNYTLGKAISYDYNCGNVDGEPFFLHVSLQTVLENS